MTLGTHTTHTPSPKGDSGNSGSPSKNRSLIPSMSFFFFGLVWLFFSEIVSKLNISLERGYF